MSKCYASTVIKTAEAEVNYTEKSSNAFLYSKSLNAGKNNYTKYAYEFDTKYVGFYNGKKQGAAWCDVWYDWLHVESFGVEKAKELLCQPSKSLGAGCGYSMKYYKQNNRFFKTPMPGDQIFFYDSKKTKIAHTGLVYKVDKTYVYTIEGNTSSSSGIVANGGCVAKKKYKLNNTRIAGYGRPKYDPEPVPVKDIFSNNISVLEWQYAAVADGFKFPKHGTDGEWGPECETVAAKAICKKRILYKYKNLTKIIQRIVGVNVDGLFGNDTKKAVTAWQKAHGLEADGVVGLNTWRAMLRE